MRREQPVREKISVKKFKANRKSLNRQNLQITPKPEAILGRFKVTSVVVIKLEPRNQLFVPKEETFPIPLKYIDITRPTHTDLDVMQEKKIDDYWQKKAEARQCSETERDLLYRS